MGSAPLISPSSEERLWSALRNRVDAILDDRKPKSPIGWSSSASGIESERGRRFREDSKLLIRGLDSVASSISQLTDSLGAAQQGVRNLSKPPMTKLSQSERIEDEETQPKVKRQCVSSELLDKRAISGIDNPALSGLEKLQENEEAKGRNKLPDKEDEKISIDVGKSMKLKKAKDLAISMATKAASLARELKTMKSELCFMQDRCALLEEENRVLRDGTEKGVRADEDDLVRLQLEALLAEKSRLANENANLTRENQCLHQLVEYHQLTSQDLSASYEEAMQGICLDFSSPLRQVNDLDGASKVPFTPTAKELGLSSFSELGENKQNGA